MNYATRSLLFAFLLALPPVHAGTEIALIPKIGYVAPADKAQVLEDGRERHFESGPGYGFAVDFRHTFGRKYPCGLAAGPEFLRYKYDFGGPYRGEATTTALFGTLKFMCAPAANTRFFVGTGIGRAENEVSTPGSNAAGYDWVDHMFYQLSMAAEFGGEFLRAYTEVRYLLNRSGDPSDREYEASGYGIFLGMSIILR